MAELIARPILGEAGADQVADAIAATTSWWTIHSDGPIGAYPCEAMTTRGTQFQPAVGLYLPITEGADGAPQQISVVMTPRDAARLVQEASNVVRWVRPARSTANPDGNRAQRRSKR